MKARTSNSLAIQWTLVYFLYLVIQLMEISQDNVRRWKKSGNHFDETNAKEIRRSGHYRGGIEDSAQGDMEFRIRLRFFNESSKCDNYFAKPDWGYTHGKGLDKCKLESQWKKLNRC